MRSDVPVGVILSGGRATRLGPLATQFSKCLVTAGQQPMLVRHVQQLFAAGCDEVRVVVAPHAQAQVDGVIERAGLPRVKTVVQRNPAGPTDAIYRGVHDVGGRPVIIVMADTLLQDVTDMPLFDDVVGVAPAPADRPFCKWIDYRWEEGDARVGERVASGIYRFSFPEALTALIGESGAYENEYTMASLLNDYDERQQHLRPYETPSWLDTGDVSAVARATSALFICRGWHHLEMVSPGVVRKQGATWGEVCAAAQPPVPQLFPRVYERGADWYDMDFVDLPSLAELWLYWPSTPAMWKHVTGELRRQLSRLWEAGFENAAHVDVTERARAMYVDKLHERYVDPAIWAFGPDHLVVNGHLVPGGRKLVSVVAERMPRTVLPHRVGWLHGDPNFTNVLWSIKTGSFKLLDPRGSWGGVGPYGDTAYDVGKIAYSPWFTPIVHDLFTLDGDGPEWELSLWPKRDLEIDAVIPPGDVETAEMVVYMLLSSAPLHPEPQASALFLSAAQLAAFLWA